MNSTGFERLKWIPLESREALEISIKSKQTLGTIETPNANNWGLFLLPKNLCFKVCFRNAGLIPQAVCFKACLLVGINQILVGYNLRTARQVFDYKMPFLFHEFLAVEKCIIARDEIGFVCLSLAGKELWKFNTTGVIETYEMEKELISGTTIDGEIFSFSIPHDGEENSND